MSIAPTRVAAASNPRRDRRGVVAFSAVAFEAVAVAAVAFEAVAFAAGAAVGGTGAAVGGTGAAVVSAFGTFVLPPVITPAFEGAFEVVAEVAPAGALVVTFRGAFAAAIRAAAAAAAAGLPGPVQPTGTALPDPGVPAAGPVSAAVDRPCGPTDFSDFAVFVTPSGVAVAAAVVAGAVG